MQTLTSPSHLPTSESLHNCPPHISRSSFSTQGQLYDPIYHDSKQSNNIDMNTVYKSPGLVVISVTMFWGVALKLVRYKKEDPTDIVAMLRHGTKLNGVQWTPHIMETWIKTLCWPMGYNTYKPQQAQELRNRIHDAVHHLQTLPENSPEGPSHMALVPSTVRSPPVSSTTRSPPVLSSLHTMSNSLAPPHSFSQPPSASSLHSLYILSHSVSPPSFMGERTRRSSMNSSRHQTFSPPMPLTFTSSQSSHTISHPHSHSHLSSHSHSSPHSHSTSHPQPSLHSQPHSHSQSPFRMPEPWAPSLPPLFQPMPSTAF